MAEEGRRAAVFTAMMGGYESLNEQPAATSSALPFICLTDDPSLRSDTWRIEVIEPPRPADPVRSARSVKILGHPVVEAFEQSLWIDNTVLLRSDPSEFLGGWLDGVDVAIPTHSFRDRLADEFEAVVLSGFDDVGRVYEQARAYLEEHPALLDERPLWTGMVARRRSAAVKEFERAWFDDVLRYSRRDQLSVSVALERTVGLAWRRVDLDNHASPLHQWPLPTHRDRASLRRAPGRWLQPRELEVRDLERRAEEAQGELDDAVASLLAVEQQGLALVDAINAREALIEQQAAQLQGLAAELDATRAGLDAVIASRSWRVGRAITSLARPLRRRSGR